MKGNRVLGGAIAIILVICLVFLSGCKILGCKTKETKAVCVTVIVGAHNNFPKIPAKEFLELLASDIDEIMENGGILKLIRLDGSPDVVSDDLEYTLGENQANFEEKVAVAFGEIKPYAAEVDFLKAIRLASREMQSYSESHSGSSKRLVVIDSGISTKGALSFTDMDILQLEPSVIFEQLEQEEEVYEFPDGTQVRLAYLGETVYPQRELSNKQRNALERFYREFFVKSKIRSEDITIDKVNPHYQKAGIDGRLVWKKAPIVGIVDVDDISRSSSFKWRIEATQLYFKKNSAELKSEQKALETLAPIIDKAKENLDKMIYLEGFTATAGTKDECVALSQARCETVKKLLCDNGIYEENVVAKGYGQEDSENFKRYQDIQNGSLNPAEARKNRVVGIILK